MKLYSILAFAVVMTVGVSCKKNQPSPYENDDEPPQVRKVRYELYTRENFVGERENIQFGLFMRDAGRTIFDSTLMAMRVEDIPDSAHKIVIEKFVPGNDTSTLTVGFVYEIENVGKSWYLDTFLKGDTLKELIYPFR